MPPSAESGRMQATSPPPPPPLQSASSADFLELASARELIQQSSRLVAPEERIFSEFEGEAVTAAAAASPQREQEQQSTRSPAQMLQDFLHIKAMEEQHARRSSSSAPAAREEEEAPATEAEERIPADESTVAPVTEQEETTRMRPIPLTLPPRVGGVSPASAACASTTTEGPEIYRHFRGAEEEEEAPPPRLWKNCTHFSFSSEWLEACMQWHEDP